MTQTPNSQRNSADSEVYIQGCGVVTPFGWGMEPMQQGLAAGVATTEQACAMPAPAPAWFRHARLRRTSPIAKYVVAAGLEALGHAGEPEAAAQSAPERLGVILCIQNGCVNFSQRFFGEVLATPGMASPILFPETVFNSPASHIAAMLGRTTINYTLVGDAATFLQGMAMGAGWLQEGRVDGALVLAAEELDDLTQHAYKLFHPREHVTAGAGAVYLTREPTNATGAPNVILGGVTQTFTFADGPGRRAAAASMAAELRELAALAEAQPAATLLVDGLTGRATTDTDEARLAEEWKGARTSPKRILGEGLSTSGAWEVAAAWAQLRAEPALQQALVSVIGASEQVAGCLLAKSRY